MDIRHFKTFKSIIEEGNFSNAAAKLGYTQSTITSQIQQLEQELSIKLFEKIAVSESLMSYKLQTVLRLFKEQAPNVNLSIISLNCYSIKNILLNDEVDLGLMYDVGSQNDNLNTVKLSDFNLSLICSLLLKQEDFDLCKPNQKLNTTLIINEIESVYRKILESYFFDNKIFFNNIIKLWSIEAIKKCVASNLGISFLPRFTVEKELESGKLKELKVGCSDAKITAIYSYHKNKWISPAMSLFINLVRESFNIN